MSLFSDCRLFEKEKSRKKKKSKPIIGNLVKGIPDLSEIFLQQHVKSTINLKIKEINKKKIPHNPTSQ